MESMMESHDFLSDDLLAEALDAFESSAVPFTLVCIISSGFCPSAPLTNCKCVWCTVKTHMPLNSDSYNKCVILSEHYTRQVQIWQEQWFHFIECSMYMQWSLIWLKTWILGFLSDQSNCWIEMYYSLTAANWCRSSSARIHGNHT